MITKSRRVFLCLFFGGLACTKKAPPKTDAPPPQVEASTSGEGMSAQYLMDLAMVHRQHQHPDRALDLLDKALAQDSEGRLKGSIELRRAEVLSMLRRNEDAIEAYEAALSGLQSQEERASARMRLAQLYREAQRPEDAIRALEETLKEPIPRHVRDGIFNELVQSWLATGKLEAQISAIEERVKGKAGPDDLRLLVWAYRQAGKPDRALETLKKLSQQEPDDISHLQTLGELLFQNQQFADGIDSFKKLATRAQHPYQRATAYERIAFAYQRLGKQSLAQEWTTKLGELASPQLPYVYVQQAGLYGSLGQADKAIGAFEKGIELASSAEQKDSIRLQYAQFLSTHGREQDAAGLLEQVLKGSASEPLKNNARQILERLRSPAPQQN